MVLTGCGGGAGAATLAAGAGGAGAAAAGGGAAALRGRASWARATIALICWASIVRSQERSDGSVIRCGTAGAMVERR